MIRFEIEKVAKGWQLMGFGFFEEPGSFADFGIFITEKAAKACAAEYLARCRS